MREKMENAPWLNVLSFQKRRGEVVRNSHESLLLRSCLKKSLSNAHSKRYVHVDTHFFTCNDAGRFGIGTVLLGWRCCKHKEGHLDCKRTTFAKAKGYG